MPRIRVAAISIAALILAAACSGSAESTDPGAAGQGAADQAIGVQSGDQPSAGIRLVNATQGREIQSAPPEDLVILDVRTPEEFAEGHLEGAIMIDFYDDDFVDQLKRLDPDVPYLLYCRSGNRSGRTSGILRELGFEDVADIDGGIVAWGDAGLPLTQP